RVLGFLMAVAGGCGLCWMHFETGPLLPHEARGAGGILGDGAGSLAYVTFGGLGGTLVLLAMFLIGVTLYSGLSWLWVMDRTGYWTLELYGFLRGLAARLREEAEGRRSRKEREAVVQREKTRVEHRLPPRIETPAPEPRPGIRVEKEKQEHLFAPPADS